MNTPLDALLHQAAALQQAGRGADALALFQQVLAADPHNHPALRAMGLIQLQRQQLPVGIALLRRALEIRPDDPTTCYELGRALYRQGDLSSALKVFDQAIASRPNYAEALNARGIMLSGMGRREDAIASFLRAVALNPGYASAHNNLGNEQLIGGNTREALASFQRAVECQPDFANAHNGLGNALLALSRHAEALASFTRALTLEPRFAEAWSGQGSALAGLRRTEEALASFERALALDPGYTDVLENLGNTLLELKRFDAALEHYRRALAARPGNPHTLCNIAQAQLGKGLHHDALATYESVLAQRPDFELALTGRARALLMLGRHGEAFQAFAAIVAARPDDPELLGSFLFNLNYMDTLAPREVFDWHRQYGERFEQPLKSGWRGHANEADPDKPLRVGFVSADLRSHPVGYFMEDVLANLRREPLTLVAYANQDRDDAVTDRLRPHFHAWRDIRKLDDDAAADLIRADAIDVLVDLSGHTKGNRLLVFARKPAPVQATYLGYFSSTGLTALDYFLVDRWQAPENEELLYTETPWRLPGHHLCFTPPRLDLPVGPLPMLENGHVTFGNFNVLAKMNDAVVDSWVEILRAVPDSRLFLKSEQLDGADVAASVRARFAGRGIDADRLILEGKSPFDAYLASYRRVDIALDPFPYNGGTVSIQSLWMGVPVLTLRGDRHVARNGTGILEALGLPDWVARSRDEYVGLARELSAKPARLAELRGGLRDRLTASGLCDAPRFAHGLASAFRAMWWRWCAERHDK